MPEQTLALPLSGSEVKEEIIKLVRSSLDKDCFLNDTASYSWRRGKVVVELELNDSGIVKVEREVTFEDGDAEAEGKKTGVRVDYTLEEQAPNTVRVNADLPVPTATTTNGKPDVKPVRYNGPKKTTPHKTVTTIVR
jgi:hypothetical protein